MFGYGSPMAHPTKNEELHQKFLDGLEEILSDVNGLPIIHCAGKTNIQQHTIMSDFDWIGRWEGEDRKPKLIVAREDIRPRKEQLTFRCYKRRAAEVEPITVTGVIYEP